ncbi:hypothetical protein [Salipiger sp.]|uniref:hypothetical protein n=1 Tax=Salipiger sp. TaxID=2078585 RepID=UPI003A96F4B1
MRAGAVLCALVLAAPVAAFEIDYDRLFRDHADRVMVAEPGVERLELPGPVIVERRGTRIRATDQSGWGPAGCAVDRLVSAATVVLACPDRFTPEIRDRVAFQALRGARFFAANTAPSGDAAGAEGLLRETLARRLESDRAALDRACADPESPLVAFAWHLAEEASLQRFEKILSQPRLPVSHPCP